MTAEQERQLAVRLSIDTHGGPWGGCDECHQHEENTLSLDPEAIALWLQHLNQD